jgi:hypothetical protein
MRKVTPSGHIYKQKNTSNFGYYYYKQKLKTFKLINTTIPSIPLFNLPFLCIYFTFTKARDSQEESKWQYSKLNYVLH